MPVVDLIEASDQRVAIDLMVAKAQKALLMEEDDLAAALFNTYERELKVLIQDLVALNYPVINSETMRISQWRKLKLDQASIELIATRMTGINQVVAQDLLDDLTAFYKHDYSMTSWTIDQSTPPNIEPRYTMPTDDVIKVFVASPWKGEMFSDRLWAINNEMARRLQRSLTDGIQAGDSMDDIARSMRKDVGVPPSEKLSTRPRASAQVYRAMLIARTEAMRVSSMVRNHLYDQNKDILQDMVWQAAPGFIRVCDECAERDGMTKDEVVEEYGEMEAETPLHPNCRCIYALVPKPFQTWTQDYWKDYTGQEPGEYAMVLPDSSGVVASVKVVPYEDWMNS